VADRDDDVLLLAEHFIALNRRNGNSGITRLAPEVVGAFRSYDWQGNVRELRNVIERAMILEDGEVISPRYLPRDLAPNNEAGNRQRAQVIDASATVTLPLQGLSLDEVEASLMKQALAQAGGNQTRAADLVGLTRDQFRYRLKRIRSQESSQRPSNQPAQVHA
jgi:DNA-binding NtrC family response regulator